MPAGAPVCDGLIELFKSCVELVVVGVPVDEVVGDILDGLRWKGVSVLVELLGLEVEVVLFGVVEVWAEAVERDWVGGAWRWQVGEARNEIEVAVEDVVRLTGRPEEEVPLDVEGEADAVLEKAQVDEGGGAFAHELEGRRIERLDAGLDDEDAGIAEGAEMVCVEGGPDLVHHGGAGRGGEAGEDFVEVGDGHDGVDGEEEPAAWDVAEEIPDVGDGVFRCHGAVLHGETVEAAEGAGDLLAPTAASRSFEEQHRRELIRRDGGLEAVEKGVVIEGEVAVDVEIDADGAGGGGAVAGEDAGDLRVLVVSAGEMTVNEGREGDEGRTGEDVVDLRDPPGEFAAHFGLAGGAYFFYNFKSIHNA